jgi:hypothetical protein
MFTPRAARRTDLRRLPRDHRLVVDAEIAAADNPSRAGRVPTLSCCRTYLVVGRTYLVVGPLADATRHVLGRVEQQASSDLRPQR